MPTTRPTRRDRSPPASDTNCLLASLQRLGVRLLPLVMASGCGGGDETQTAPGFTGAPGQSGSAHQIADAGVVPRGGAVGTAAIPSPTVGTRPGTVVDVSPSTCARAELTIKRTIPTVWLLIDGSGSMGGDPLGFNLDGPSRWASLRQVLLDPVEGLIPRLQASVSFGLMIYDGGLSLPGIHVDGVCPRVVTVDPVLNNYGSLNAAYPPDALGASTPTHYALEELSSRIARQGPSPLGPTYVILATDGKPNLCDFHDGIPASAATEQEAVTTVQSLADRGTKVFAVSMAGGDGALRTHLEQVARAGGTGQPVFDPGSKDALAGALSAIVGGTASCEAQIQGSIVKGRECAGDVRLGRTSPYARTQVREMPE